LVSGILIEGEPDANRTPDGDTHAVQRRTHASFGHNAVALAARGTDVAGEDRPCRGYAVSQRRKRIEEPFGWGKTIGELARPMLRGVEKLGFKFTLTMAGYNLIRLPKLIAAQA